MEYHFCALCRKNYPSQNRHVHSNTHKRVVNQLLQRNVKKTERYKEYVVPQLLSSALELKSMWCLFCNCDVRPISEHIIAEVEVVGVHVVRHLALDSHRKSVASWYRLYCIDQDIPQTSFIIDKDTVSQFEMTRAEMLKSTLSKARKRHFEESCIETKSTINLLPVSGSHEKHLCPVASTSKSSHSSVIGMSPPCRPSHGNVHDLNAIPPWLENKDSDTVVSKIIGPSTHDFQKSVHMEKKRKLNPNRVGANISLSEKVSEHWLPDFGRVWNAGSRRTTREEFYREKTNKWK